MLVLFLTDCVSDVSFFFVLLNLELKSTGYVDQHCDVADSCIDGQTGRCWSQIDRTGLADSNG